jgi:C4-dicarboxylate-specific signal transduction histidine kinase
MPEPSVSTTPSVATDHAHLQMQLQHLEDEFHKMQKQLWHAQRLASLGTMAAMVAHEYNNLMTPVVSFARYALEHTDDP